MSINPVLRLSPLLRASFWMVGTLVSFSAMAVAGRELSDTMSIFEILFFRALVAMVIVSALIPKQGWGSLRTSHMSIHVIRNTIHFAAQFGWFLGISLLPLATVFALEYTLPIWSAILAVIFLGEKMNRGRIIAIVCGFAGVLIILRPGAEAINIASLAVLAAAFGYATSYITTKKLSAFDTPISIVFYMNLMQLPLGLVPALFDWAVPTLGDIPWIFLVGVSGLTAHYTMTRAFLLADTMLVVPLDYMRLPLIALVGFLLYAETVDIALLIGAVVIFAGNFYNIRLESRAAKNKE